MNKMVIFNWNFSSF